MMARSTAQDTAGAYYRTGSGPRYAMVEIRVDQAKLDTLLAKIQNIPNAADRVVPPAMNKATAEMKTWLYREFLARMNIGRKASVRDRISLDPKASRGRWTAGVLIALTRFAVTSFKGTRQVKAGIQWQPRPGKQQLIPRAFLRKGYTHYQTDEYMDQRMPWRRAGGMGADAKLVGRYPLFVMRGPSLARVFSDDSRFQENAETHGGEVLEKKIDQQADWIVGGLPK